MTSTEGPPQGTKYPPVFPLCAVPGLELTSANTIRKCGTPGLSHCRFNLSGTGARIITMACFVKVRRESPERRFLRERSIQSHPLIKAAPRLMARRARVSNKLHRLLVGRNHYFPTKFFSDAIAQRGRRIQLAMDNKSLPRRTLESTQPSHYLVRISMS